MAQFVSLSALAAHVNSQEDSKFLGTCQITGRFDPANVKPAVIVIVRDGVEERHRLLIHKNIRTGRKARGGVIKSIKRGGLRASVNRKATYAGNIRRFAVISKA